MPPFFVPRLLVAVLLRVITAGNRRSPCLFPWVHMDGGSYGKGFVPSLHLPTGRSLDAARAGRALAALRRGFGLPPRGTSVVRNARAPEHVHPELWPVWLGRLLPPLPPVQRSTDDENSAGGEKSGGAEQYDSFEHGMALAWLQRVVSGKATLVDSDAVTADSVLDAAAELLAQVAGKSGKCSFSAFSCPRTSADGFAKHRAPRRSCIPFAPPPGVMCS